MVVAGTHSGVGKTTVATGIMAALREQGRQVSAAKVGPDFIDPGYHALATGRPPRNLDPWMCGLEAVPSLAARAAAGAEVLVVEGVMGLFDGAADGSPSSTADVALALEAPVVLVVDGSAMSASVAALVRGFRDHVPELRLAGVVLNRVDRDLHRQLLTESLDAIGVPVLGRLPRSEEFCWRDRHLGLVPVAERPSEVRDSLLMLGAAVSDGCDLDGILDAARGAPDLAAPAPRTPERVGSCTVAVAAGAAFTFTYQDNVEALEAAGARIVEFDPRRDPMLPPDIDGLVVGGGFPEVHARELSANTSLLADARDRIRAGLMTWAECGGLLWLCENLDGHPLAGVLGARASMTERLRLGYRQATALIDSPLAAAGTTLRGHEFHYSTVLPEHSDPAAFVLESRAGRREEGFASETMAATYLHVHMGADTAPAERFVASCCAGLR